MTNLELLSRADVCERDVYVYMWLYKTGEGDVPFYVGIGTKNRYKDKCSRSKHFKDFLANHECYPAICVKYLTRYVAREVEISLKTELRKNGISLIDAEDSMREHRQRQKEGIAAKRASDSWDEYGRPRKEVPEFEKFLKKQKDGKLTVAECCEQLGISRATWYNKLKEVS